MTVSSHPQQTPATLAARLLAPDVFAPFAADCRTLIVDQIKRRGMTLRTAVRVVHKIKPNIVDRIVDEQMPDLLHELEPFYAAYNESETPDFATYLIAREGQVADAILDVADRRAERLHSATIRSAYQRIRGRGRREVLAAVPELATVIARHAEPEGRG